MLKGKRIILGITGGIAAYKIPLLVRELKKKEADVQCIMTPASCDFVSPLTLATLSQNPVCIDFWNVKDGTWTNHVELGMWADLMVIAPLTANTLAKMTNGGCDNLLLATYLSAKCPVLVAPAMDLDMYAHPTTSENLKRLEQHGVQIAPAEHGFLASGLEGQGRMTESAQIVEHISFFFEQSTSMEGKKVLVTAGPTYERIDPVRFVGNHSSGKMGFALAKNLLKRGAEVILITGPTQCELFHKNVTRIDILSADEMLVEVQNHFPSCDGGIFSAAVSDYKPVNPSAVKLKKTADELTIHLLKNPDILQWAGDHKKENQFLVGFALETNNALEYGKGKLEKKNLDFIVVNSLEDSGAGFGHDTNKITILDSNNNVKGFELSTKDSAANTIVDYIVKSRL
jgi:phosphopantothenoylcysteine decarboxylase/phosphopantothenate--cysteine ligase